MASPVYSIFVTDRGPDSTTGGSYLEHVTQNDPVSMARLMKGLDEFLERDRDRELFDLAPRGATHGRLEFQRDSVPSPISVSYFFHLSLTYSQNPSTGLLPHIGARSFPMRVSITAPISSVLSLLLGISNASGLPQ